MTAASRKPPPISDAIVANGGWHIRHRKVWEKPRAGRAWRVFAGTSFMASMLAILFVLWQEPHVLRALPYALAFVTVALFAQFVRALYLSTTEVALERDIVEYLEIGMPEFAEGGSPTPPESSEPTSGQLRPPNVRCYGRRPAECFA